MSAEPSQISAQVDALLAELPMIATGDDGATTAGDLDIDDIARRLEEAHDVLVHALESVEKG